MCLRTMRGKSKPGTCPKAIYEEEISVKHWTGLPFYAAEQWEAARLLEVSPAEIESEPDDYTGDSQPTIPLDETDD